MVNNYHEDTTQTFYSEYTYQRQLSRRVVYRLDSTQSGQILTKIPPDFKPLQGDLIKGIALFRSGWLGEGLALLMQRPEKSGRGSNPRDGANLLSEFLTHNMKFRRIQTNDLKIIRL